MGGRVSYLVACELADKIRAAAPFYGGGIPIDRTAKLKAPVLAFFGEQDGFIPLAFVEQLRAEAAKQKKQVEIVVYPGAGHGFFCNERSSYDPRRGGGRVGAAQEVPRRAPRQVGGRAHPPRRAGGVRGGGAARARLGRRHGGSGGVSAGRGAKLDPLKAAALERGIAVHQFRSLKAPEARAAFERADADLGLLAYVTQIVPEPLLRIPRQTSLCFHPSLLPRYRGGAPSPGSSFAARRAPASPYSGRTRDRHRADPAAARGERRPDDTAGTLYYKKLYPLGVQTCLDAVALVREGRAPRVAQDESLATYDPLLTDAHSAIDWAHPAAEVHDLIRGCDPQPGAHTACGGVRLRLYEPHRVAGDAAPGTVLACDAGGLTIAAAGGAVRCARARNGGGKAAAADVARAIGLAVGARLG
jgi:methionyl-tRNA formyltransferase